MKRIVRLTENDLTKIVRKVIKEQSNDQKPYDKIFNNLVGKTAKFYQDENKTDFIAKGTINSVKAGAEVAGASNASGGLVSVFLKPGTPFKESALIMSCKSGNRGFKPSSLHSDEVYSNELEDYVRKNFCDEFSDSDFAQKGGEEESDFT
jgi:hypothetical protein